MRCFKFLAVGLLVGSEALAQQQITHELGWQNNGPQDEVVIEQRVKERNAANFNNWYEIRRVPGTDSLFVDTFQDTPGGGRTICYRLWSVNYDLTATPRVEYRSPGYSNEACADTPITLAAPNTPASLWITRK